MKLQHIWLAVNKRVSFSDVYVPANTQKEANETARKYFGHTEFDLAWRGYAAFDEEEPKNES